MLTGQLGGRLTRRSFLGQNIEATALQSLITAVLLAAATRMMGAVTRNPTIPFTDLVLVSVIGAVLSSVVVTGVVLLLTPGAGRAAALGHGRDRHPDHLRVRRHLDPPPSWSAPTPSGTARSA